MANGWRIGPEQEYEWTLAETGDEEAAQKAARELAAAILRSGES